MRPNSRHMSSFFFPFSICLVILTVVISEIGSLTCVVISKEEKHVPYGELVSTTECITL
jgi:hypothetical protein